MIRTDDGVVDAHKVVGGGEDVVNVEGVFCSRERRETADQDHRDDQRTRASHLVATLVPRERRTA